MKKLIIIKSFICMFIVFISLNSIVCKANEVNTSIVKEKLKISTNKEEKIKDLLDKQIEENKNDNIKKYNIDNAFEMYILPDLFLTEYNNKKSISELFSKETKTNVNIITESGENGRALISFNNDMEPKLDVIITGIKEEAIVPSFETLDTTINDNISAVKDVNIAHSYRYRTTFIVISTKSDEYLIPYCTAPENIGLNNGEIYLTKDAIRIMSSIYDESAAIEQGELNGGTPTREYNNTFILWIISYVLLAIITTLIIKNKKIRIK